MLSFRSTQCLLLTVGMLTDFLPVLQDRLHGLGNHLLPKDMILKRFVEVLEDKLPNPKYVREQIIKIEQLLILPGITCSILGFIGINRILNVICTLVILLLCIFLLHRNQMQIFWNKKIAVGNFLVLLFVFVVISGTGMFFQIIKPLQQEKTELQAKIEFFQQEKTRLEVQIKSLQQEKRTPKPKTSAIIPSTLQNVIQTVFEAKPEDSDWKKKVAKVAEKDAKKEVQTYYDDVKKREIRKQVNKMQFNDDERSTSQSN